MSAAPDPDVLKARADEVLDSMPEDDRTMADRIAHAVAIAQAELNGGEPRTLAEVEATYQKWLHLPDLGALRIVLAAVAANRLDHDPVWLLLVAAPSSGKTEILNGLPGLPDVYPTATLTEPALLSGSPKRERGKDATGGLLRQIGDYGVILAKDFGSVLSMHRDARAQVLAALREVYDGSWTRLLGVDGGKTLHWEGKTGLIAGCTPTVDRHHEVMSQMGDRFLLYRLPPAEREKQIRRSLGRADSAEMRRELAEVVSGFFVGLGVAEPRALSDDDIGRLSTLALFATSARSAVERDGYQRDIVLVPDMEAPARLGNQLRGVLDGLDVIGIERDEAWRIVAKAALDSIPALRLDVLGVLLGKGWLTTTEIEKAVAYPNTTTRRTLEDLHAHGLVARETGGQAHNWKLADEPARQLVEIRRWTFPEMSGGPLKGASESEESASITTNTVVETTFRERSNGAPAQRRDVDEMFRERGYENGAGR